ncbi:MAG: bile acid:sodium symporter family protein [bacterium]
MKRAGRPFGIIAAAVLVLCGGGPPLAHADERKPLTKEALYKHLAKLARSEGGGALFEKLTSESRAIDWKQTKSRSFTGNLRRLEVKANQGKSFYLVRELSGDIHVLWVPKDSAKLKKGAGGAYGDLKSKLGSKVTFEAQVATRVVDGVEHRFLRLTKAPTRLLLDRLFFIAIVILLFMTMVGMGLTLTLKDFALVFRKPAGMIIGILCQFGLLPALAYVVGRAFGYYTTYPFIFLGLILIASSPGGVTSNLMTYFAKGDVALSVSLTAVCTVASLLFTPLLLGLYGANIPDFSIPVLEVFKQILVLVIVPLFVGMLIRGKWEGFAKRAEKPFAMIGVFALLFLIVVGVWSNLEKFGDTARYGVRFYVVVFLLTLAGMVVAGAIAKIFRISNFQIRAISLECGLRNASLAMTIAILLQDRIGDFHSSMFFTSGIFGLWMYAAGAFSIYTFQFWLPVKPGEGKQETTSAET